MNDMFKQVKILWCLLATCIMLMAFLNAVAQDTAEVETYPVIETFRHTQLINHQTTEALNAPGGIEFKIQHRFGMVGLNESFYKEFFGLAIGANIRIALALHVTEKLYFGVGWNRFNKTFDFEGKYVALRQTEENEMPVSVAVYHNMALRADAFPVLPKNVYFSDSTTIFKYKPSHRFLYNIQLVIARKFSEKLSLHATGVFIYRNLVNEGKQNHTIAMPVGGRFKFSKNSSLLLEYAYVFNKKKVYNDTDKQLLDPVSIGVEFATSGHVFQIVISSSQQMVEQQIYTTNPDDYLKGNFHLGFNIKRNLFY